MNMKQNEEIYYRDLRKKNKNGNNRYETNDKS